MLTVLCLIFIAVTMFFRVSDIRNKTGLLWRARMLGLCLTGVGSIGCVLYDWLLHSFTFSWSQRGLLFGLVLVFLTSPHLPPYWKWISGKMGATDGTA